MLVDSTFYLPKFIKAEQLRLLNSKHGLFQLFDKIQAKPLFSVPENSLVINLDNITFGPDKYSITTPQNEDILFQIIYYSILYYAFQRKQEKSSRKVYQNLLTFVINNDIPFFHPQVSLSQLEIKVFIVKFLHILASAKNKRKVVLEELNNVPQIHFIFIELIKQIAKSREIKFEKNAREIQKNIKEELGLQIDLLSCQMILLGEEFQVQIRNFGQLCQFSVYPDSLQNIAKIKSQFYLGESAYFQEQDKQPQLCGETETHLMRKRNTVIKKSTITSIQWEGQKDQDEREPNDFDKQNDFGWNNSQLMNHLPINDEKGSQKCTNVESSLGQLPKVLNFNQIIQQSSKIQFNDIPAQTVKSTIYYNPPKQDILQRRFHKPSLQIKQFLTHLHKDKFIQTSYSVKCIRSDGFNTKYPKQTKERTVPTFILNRAKAKEEKPKEEIQIPKVTQSPSLKKIKITFSYRTN